MTREQKIKQLIEKGESEPQRIGNLNYIYFFTKRGVKRMDNKGTRYNLSKWYEAKYTKWDNVWDRQIEYYLNLA